MLLNMPKKQSEEIKLEDDALLGDILGQIKSKSTTNIKRVVKTPVATPTLERNPFIKKGTGLKKTVTVTKTVPSTSTSEPNVETQENAENLDLEDMDFPDQMDEFDEEMPMDSFTEEPPKDEIKTEKETEEILPSRGFIPVAENKIETAGITGRPSVIIKFL